MISSPRTHSIASEPHLSRFPDDQLDAWLEDAILPNIRRRPRRGADEPQHAHSQCVETGDTTAGARPLNNVETDVPASLSGKSTKARARRICEERLIDEFEYYSHDGVPDYEYTSRSPDPARLVAAAVAFL